MPLPGGGLTSHSTGAAIARLSFARLNARFVVCRPVNSGVRCLHLSKRMDTQVARKLLANMPDELYSLYMEPLIEQYGWPFTSPDSPTIMPWWRLFDGLPFKIICQLSWERQEFPFSFGLFHRYARTQIQGLISTHIFGLKNEYSSIPNTEARFHRARDYIERTGRMPVPVVLIQDPGGLRILDGNHRLAAIASLPSSISNIVDGWIGSL
jgi:hypothetical protein